MCLHELDYQWRDDQRLAAAMISGSAAAM